MEFFLSGAEPLLNSVNSEKLVNHKKHELGSIRGLNPSAVWESLRGIIPVHDHPGLLLFIRESDNTKIKASFPGVEQFIKTNITQVQ